MPDAALTISASNPRLLRPRALQFLADVVAFISGFLTYQWVRMAALPEIRMFSFLDTLVVSSVVCMYWISVFWLGGLYKDLYVQSPFDEFFKVIRQTFFGSAVFFIFIYLSSGPDYQKNPRFIFVLYWVLLCGFVCIGRLAARQTQRSLRERGIIRIPALLICSLSRVHDLLDDLKKEKAWGYVVRGIVLIDQSNQLESIRSIPVLGTITSLPEIIRETDPAEVLISVDQADHSELLMIVAQAADAGCKVRIVPDMYEIVSGQARTQQMYGSPLIDVNPELMQPWEEFAKRTLDILVSSIILLVGLPVWVLVGVLIKLTSRGPVFYMQPRVGKNGHVYHMIKFRSMYFKQDDEPAWTLKNDPRVTPIGRFIRATHLDEIPQMWNVLRGEMSLVGPRPEQPYYVDKFTQMLPYYRRRLKVRPGITGWWQVKARSNPESLEEIEQRLRYDFFYIENMSFKLDLEILVRTVFVMLQGHGRA